MTNKEADNYLLAYALCSNNVHFPKNCKLCPFYIVNRATFDKECSIDRGELSELALLAVNHKTTTAKKEQRIKDALSAIFDSNFDEKNPFCFNDNEMSEYKIEDGKLQYRLKPQIKSSDPLEWDTSTVTLNRLVDLATESDTSEQ